MSRLILEESRIVEQSEIQYIDFLEIVLKKKYGILLLSTILFCFVFLTTYPKYLDILLDPTPIKTYYYYFRKINFPLESVKISNDTHGSKIAFRLTVPLLAKILNIGSNGSGKKIVFIYIIQSLLLFPFFIILIKLIRRFTKDSNVILFVISCSSIYLTKAFFWDYDFWFDGFAYFFLLLGMFFRSKLGVFCCLQLACWTDERAVIALLSIYLFHLLQENNFNLYQFKQIFNGKFLSRNSSIIIFTGIFYALLRVFLSASFGLYTPHGTESGVGLDMIPFQFKHRLIGIFLTFEGFWIIFIVAIYIMMKNKNFLLILLIVGCMLIHIVVAYSVFDITRSLTYAFPLLIISSVFVLKNVKKSINQLFITSALICLLIPTQYLIYFTRQIPWTISSYPEIKLIIKSAIRI